MLIIMVTRNRRVRLGMVVRRLLVRHQIMEVVRIMDTMGSKAALRNLRVLISSEKRVYMYV